MKISARNALPGKIVDIKMGATTAHVRIERHDRHRFHHQRVRRRVGVEEGRQRPRHHQGVGRVVAIP